MSNSKFRWLQLSVTFAAIAIVSVILPTQIAPDTFVTAKAKGAVVLYNLTIGPMMQSIGKVPLLVLFSAFALVALIRAVGLRRPTLPKIEMPSFSKPDHGADLLEVPMQRRRGLEEVSVVPPEPPRPAPTSPSPLPVNPPEPTRAAPDPSKAFAAAVSSDGAIANFLAAAIHGQRIDRMSLLEQWRLYRPGQPDPSEAALARAEALALGEQKRATAPRQRIDPIVLARKPREPGRDWSGDASWLGGLPRLGECSWPIGKDGTPLPFVAQIDLAELAAVNPDTPLPKEGSLAFFIGKGAVVHVPAGDHPPTPPPVGLPPAYDEANHPLPQRWSRLSRQTFPFWPVEPLRLKMPPDLPDPSEDSDVVDEIYEAQDAALHALVKPRQYSFSVESAAKAGVASAGKLWWYVAHHVLDQLREVFDSAPVRIAREHESIAKGSEYQARLRLETPEPERDKKLADSERYQQQCRDRVSQIEAEAIGLSEFIPHFEGFAAGHRDWEEMNAAEVVVLKDAILQAREDFSNLCRFGLTWHPRDLGNLCVRRMMTGDADAFAALPEDMRRFVNDNYRLTSSSQMQMFGLGQCIQTALYDHLNDHLLLQLGYEDLTDMGFGDMGHHQFWIAPDDLAAQRFDKVQLTFECS
jgi:Domain of unknown function (DUF1963)